MSRDGGPGHDPSQPPSGTGGCFAAFLIVLGIAALLPGLCYMALGRAGGSNLAATGVLYTLVGVVLLIFAGALLAKRPKPPPLWPPKVPNTAVDAAKNSRPNTPEHGDGGGVTGLSRQTLLALLLLAGVILLVLWLLQR